MCASALAFDACTLKVQGSGLGLSGVGRLRIGYTQGIRGRGGTGASKDNSCYPISTLLSPKIV